MSCISLQSTLVLTLVLLCGLSTSTWTDTIYRGTCRFSHKYSNDQLLNNATARKEYVQSVLHYEGNFHSHMNGINVFSGMTIDGCKLDPVTGNTTSPRRYTAASKESLHLSMLALALNGPTAEGYDPLDYFHYPINLTATERKLIHTGDNRVDNVLVTAYRKMDTLERFNAQQPGYGGYVPWSGVNDNGLDNDTQTDTSVPSLDNGEMVWGIYAVAHVLKQKYPDHAQLATRYRNYFDLLANNAITVFLNRTSFYFAMSAVVGANNVSVAKNTYRSDGIYSSSGPFEGELFAVFADIFGKWENPTQRDSTWDLSLYKLNWTIPAGVITVQRGWTYSSHEAWKYIMMPYQSVPIQARILANCEKARTWFSTLSGYPGLFAASYNSTLNYVTSVGIANLSRASIDYNDFYTPYGAFPVLMANHSVGLVWYNNMLKGPAMQGPYGSTESGTNDGKAVANIMSWDTKGPSVIAMLGGIGDIVKEALVGDRKYQMFFDRINSSYTAQMPYMVGDNVPYGMPPPPAPDATAHYTLCDDYVAPPPSTGIVLRPSINLVIISVLLLLLLSYTS
ncbi:hypothetical protein SAMD00019534_085070 [Acytostelium subglobosum LB1]|uniref:hypothetical protein n=1 Tax=Acytostelium subglobosum LB1 TaxID=1410327 RepID=UPI000644A81F|nr:hypothetical protein SAMD00019534_085070 [Acytostelium subglobosum LB1]GAM25332.1 hypothetical protein SAMD00019534_085070 [Acytostelium subglobosum LB1]|eukprot:XP_012751852.1 hypothetical protein SAMD00019534_085070 [Acytostelium subglobosum LB1]